MLTIFTARKTGFISLSGFIFFIGIQLFACHPPKRSADSNAASGCKTSGVVKDFTGLDGCKFLIVLPDGKKLLPGKLPDAGFEFYDGQKVNFDYREMKDYGMTICMAEDMIVEITCIEEPGAPKKPACTDTDTPEKVDWMLAILKKEKPYRVLKYQDNGKWFYYFQGGPNSFFYDCKGELICTVPGKMMNDCYQTVQLLGAGKVVWQGEGNNE